MQPANKASHGGHKRRGWHPRPTHAELLASLTPIVSRGPFSLVCVNPNPHPVDLHPEEPDYDPQGSFKD
jgi:hypothetical protein